MVEVLRFMFESPLNYCGTLFAVFWSYLSSRIDESKEQEGKKTHENHLFSSKSGCMRVHF